MKRISLLALLVTAPGWGCELLVAAASDLAPLEAGLKRAGGECQLKFVFGSSGTLARQVRAGAGFDVFLAANRSFATDLVKDGLADGGTLTLYARGRIALWGAARWEELTSSRVKSIALANPALAPYGLAAKQALERRGLWPKVEAKVVYGENIRQTWQFARSGNVDAAIVSWSLAREDAARAWKIPLEWHAPVEQTGVVIRQSKRAAEAKRFLGWLRSSEGQKVLEDGGLERVEPGGGRR